MNDSPYFERTTGLQILLFLVFLLFYGILFRKREWIERIPYPALLIFFGIVAESFVLLIPITPISDPEYVVQGALSLARGNAGAVFSSEYLQSVLKNIKVSAFYAFFCLLLPKTVLSLRTVNVVFYLLTALFSGKIARSLLGEKTGEKTTFLLTASFFPLIIYTNQVYFDMPVLMLSTAALAVYLKKRSLREFCASSLILGIAASLRISALVFAVAILIDFLISYWKNFTTKKNIFWTIIAVIVTFSLPGLTDSLTDMLLRLPGAEKESIWSLFWMGINEPEFGMMHNEYMNAAHDCRSAGTFFRTLCSRDVIRNLRLFGRKILWTWTQGTYQCQRYGFGYNMEASEKFLYQTFLTSHMMTTDQKLPRLLIHLCRGQYMAFFTFMTVGIFRTIREKTCKNLRILIYPFSLTFLVMIFYEMKSRYTFHLLTCMIILAVYGLCGFCELKNPGGYVKTDGKTGQNREKSFTAASGLSCASLFGLLKMALALCFIFTLAAGLVSHAWNVKLNAEQARVDTAKTAVMQAGLDLEERTVSVPNVKREYDFLFVSDTHVDVSPIEDLPAWGLTGESRRALFTSHTNGMTSDRQFESWVKAAETMHADGLLLGGDIIDFGDSDNVAWLSKQLNVLSVPYLYTMGNHDSFDVMDNTQNFDNAALAKLFINNDVYCASVDYGSFIVCQVNDALNAVPEQALEEFRKVYEEGKPIILMCHVPLYTEDNLERKERTEEIRGEDRLIGYGLARQMDAPTREFFDLVTAKDSPVVCVLDGHVHFRDEDLLNGRIAQYTNSSATDGQAYLIRVTQ